VRNELTEQTSARETTKAFKQSHKHSLNLRKCPLSRHVSLGVQLASCIKHAGGCLESDNLSRTVPALSSVTVLNFERNTYVWVDSHILKIGHHTGTWITQHQFCEASSRCSISLEPHCSCLHYGTSLGILEYVRSLRGQRLHQTIFSSLIPFFIPDTALSPWFQRMFAKLMYAKRKV